MTDKAAALEWKNKGNDAFKAGNYLESIDFFTKAIKADPEDHVLYSNRSGSYASMSNFPKALEDANKCVRLNPNWAKGWSRKGFAECQMGKFEEAESSYRRGLEVDATNAACKDGLRQTMEERKSNAKSLDGAKLMLALRHPRFAACRGEEAFEESLSTLMEKGTFDASKADRRVVEAVTMAMTYSTEELQKIVENAIKDVEAVKERKKAEDANKKVAEAMAKENAKPEALKEAEKIKEEATAEYKKRNFEKALELYGKAYETYPSELVFLNNQAAVYIEMGEFQKAIDKCDEAIALRYDVKAPFETVAKIYCRKGAVYTKMGDFKQAVAMYDKALLEDNNKTTRVALADAQRALKTWEAQQYINPELADEHRAKGNDLFKACKYIDAKKEYDEAIKRNPKDARSWTNRAATLTKLLEYPSALKDCEEAIKVDETFIKAYIRKGQCHHMMKEYNKAVQAYQKGLLFDAENAELKRELEKTLMQIESSSRSSNVDDEQVNRAMQDPEIQKIMSDPQFRLILQTMQENPSSMVQYMKDPNIASNLQKLMAAGILRTN